MPIDHLRIRHSLVTRDSPAIHCSTITERCNDHDVVTSRRLLLLLLSVFVDSSSSRIVSRFWLLASNRCGVPGIKWTKRKKKNKRRKNRGWIGQYASTNRCGSVEVARKDCGREKGGKSAWSRAFIAYGSAKHLWNNGAGQVHRWRRKTKVFSTREPQDGILLLATTNANHQDR